MQDPRHEVETLRARIAEGEREIDDPADRDILLEFSNRLDLLRQDYGPYRHLKLLRHCTRMAEHVGGLAAALEDRAAAEAIVRWINTEYDPGDPKKDVSEETNRDYRVALRVFGKRVIDEEGLPDSLTWVTATYSNTYDRTPDPAEMLDWETDVRQMLDAARNPRDKALIAVQYDGGFRGGELYDMTVGDVSDSTHSVTIRVDGKTGPRSVHLIPSVPYLQRWLIEHPAGDDPDAPLWSKLDTPERYSYTRFLQSFKEPAARAGVEKPVTPTNFRKSSATWLAKLGASESYLNVRQGRKQGSKVTARYVAQFGGADAESMYAQLHGIEVDDEEATEIGPLKCPRCQRETPRHEEFCVWCHFALTPEADDEVAAQDDRFFASAVQAPRAQDTPADTEVTTEDVLEARQLFKEHPALRRVLLAED